MVAKKSQEAKNDTAKLKKVQDQASSSIDVKKSLINLAMKIWGDKMSWKNPPVPVMHLLSPAEGVDPAMLGDQPTFLRLSVHHPQNPRGFAERIPPIIQEVTM